MLLIWIIGYLFTAGVYTQWHESQGTTATQSEAYTGLILWPYMLGKMVTRLPF